MKTIRNTNLFFELKKVHAEGGNLLAAIFDDHDGMPKDERIPCFASALGHVKITDRAFTFYDPSSNDVTRKFRICRELPKK